ncbi:MAG: dipeptidase [Lachnospiraceae bacterium]|jgi:membrane dipeptidase|nr:dipeptidase [Lachnospiraceae bacterium]
MDMKIDDQFRRQAEQLHCGSPVVDAHLDLAGEILLRQEAGEKDIIARHYLENFKKAGLSLLISSIYVDDVMLPEKGLRNALNQISALQSDLAGLADEVVLIKNSTDFESARDKGLIGILLYMEGLDCIGDDLRLLSTFYELGVRGASLTWSRRNQLANGCCRAREHIQIPGGLSAAGRSVIRELERYACFIDISHLNDDGFDEVMALTTKPVIATHSNARSVYDSYRNLTDAQIKKLAERGGMIGINGCTLIAGSHKQGNHLEMLCKHIEHIVQLVGSDHVGYGFDLCDSYGRAEPRLQFEATSFDCLADHSEMVLVTAALLQRGMPAEAVRSIIGGNFYRYIHGIV